MYVYVSIMYVPEKNYDGTDLISTHGKNYVIHIGRMRKMGSHFDEPIAETVKRGTTTNIKHQ